MGSGRFWLTPRDGLALAKVQVAHCGRLGIGRLGQPQGALDRLRNRGRPDHTEPEAIRVPEVRRPAGHRDRDPRDAHLDGLAEQPGDLPAFAVHPLIPDAPLSWQISRDHPCPCLVGGLCSCHRTSKTSKEVSRVAGICRPEPAPSRDLLRGRTESGTASVGRIVNLGVMGSTRAAGSGTASV
jgi:hypothetical protein